MILETEFAENIVGLLWFVLVFGTSVGLPFYAVMHTRRQAKRDKLEQQQKMKDAVEKITADGKVEGPKGPYVPHKQHGHRTDNSTAPASHSGYTHPWH